MVKLRRRPEGPPEAAVLRHRGAASSGRTDVGAAPSPTASRIGAQAAVAGGREAQQLALLEGAAAPDAAAARGQPWSSVAAGSLAAVWAWSSAAAGSLGAAWACASPAVSASTVSSSVAWSASAW